MRAINNKESETWKVQCESTEWKVQSMVHENNMENIALLIFDFVKENIYIFCFFVFQIMLFSVITSRALHSRFVGEELRVNFFWIVLFSFC